MMNTTVSNTQWMDSFFKQWVCVAMNSTPQDESRLINQELDNSDIQQTLNGDNTAFARLVRRYEQSIAAIMWRFTRDPKTLEELVQDVFVEAFLHLKSYKGASPFFYWLRTIAYRCGYRYWKRIKRERARQTDIDQIPMDAATDAIETPSEAAEFLFRLLETMPIEDRTILTLHYFEELSMDEVAQRLGWTRTWVKVRAHRARINLKKKLEAAGLGQTNESKT